MLQLCSTVQVPCKSRAITVHGINNKCYIGDQNVRHWDNLCSLSAHYGHQQLQFWSLNLTQNKHFLHFKFTTFETKFSIFGCRIKYCTAYRINLWKELNLITSPTKLGGIHIASWLSLPKEENKNPEGFLDRGPGKTHSDLVGNPLSLRWSDSIMRRFLL